jgi:hypothetical protein
MRFLARPASFVKLFSISGDEKAKPQTDGPLQAWRSSQYNPPPRGNIPAKGPDA